jgi:sulfur relay (sulfurtransferase) complex TusBCD TusD component (DsrE family)
MKAPLIIDDPPYGTERVYNALRLTALASEQEWSDVVACKCR